MGRLNGLISKAEEKIQAVGSEEDDVESKMDKMENEGSSEERVSSVEREEEDIVEKLNSAESDLMKVLKMEQGEFEEFIEVPLQQLERKNKEEQMLSDSLESLREIDESLENLLNVITLDVGQFLEELESQFLNTPAEKIEEVAEKTRNQTSSTIPATLFPNRLDLLKQSNGGSIPSQRTADFSQASLDKISQCYNAALWEVDSSQAIEKPRYVELEEDLPQFKSVQEETNRVVEVFKQLRNSEEDFREQIGREYEEAPEKVDDLIRIGEDINELKSELERTELERDEIAEIIRNSNIRNEDGALREIDNISQEVDQLEENLQNLDQIERKLAEKVAEIEEEMEELEELTETEENELKQLLSQEEGALEKAQRLKENIFNSQDILFGERDSDVKDNTDGSIAREFRQTIENLIKLLQMLDTEAMRLDKYYREDYSKEDRLRKFTTEEINELESTF